MVMSSLMKLEYTHRITLHSMRDKTQPLTEITIEYKTVKCLIHSEAGVNVIETYYLKPHGKHSQFNYIKEDLWQQIYRALTSHWDIRS